MTVRRAWFGTDESAEHCWAWLNPGPLIAHENTKRSEKSAPRSNFSLSSCRRVNEMYYNVFEFGILRYVGSVPRSDSRGFFHAKRRC